ncbi:MAG: cache domain-containing protein [Deltaproteobacteria bacterium]|nr:cache domain-containing protein [Deltaproteobacteria bacterium]
MRNKIIAVNAVIVLIVGLLAFAIVRTQLAAEASSPDQLKRSAQRDVAGAAAQLQLDGLRAERWLAMKANEPATRAALSRATPEARGDASRQLADQVVSAAGGAIGAKPTIVALVDASGKIVGRNGSDLNRGDDVGSAYPAFKDAIAKSYPGSDVWTDKARADQYIASYAPVRDDAGKPAGMLLLGVAINDALARVGDATTGRGVVLVTAKGDVVASSANAGEDVKGAAKALAGEVKTAISTGNIASGASGDIIAAAAPLAGFGDGKSTAVIAAAPASLLPGTATISLSILGAMALGLVLVVAGGWFLGSYISGPIASLEEGLLMILNGQTDKRFELDHAELGGLAFRIDQLLNQLMGVEEDNTDDEGRVSKAPTAANFGDALSVDRSGGGGGAPAGVDPGRLAAEPAEAYYARLYAEYINAKKALGEQVDHITDAAFRSRIQGMEQDATAKTGRPVRYHVQSNGREVVLLAVPL